MTRTGAADLLATVQRWRTAGKIDDATTERLREVVSSGAPLAELPDLFERGDAGAVVAWLRDDGAGGAERSPLPDGAVVSARSAQLESVALARGESSIDPATARARRAHRAALRTLLDTSPAGAEPPTKAFRVLAHHLAMNDPHVGHVWRSIGARVAGPDAPSSPAELIAVARELAGASLQDAGEMLSPPEGHHRQNTVALWGLMAHSLKNRFEKEKRWESFPKLMPDGRTRDWGSDKTCHMLNQLGSAYFMLVGETVGKPDFERLVERAIEQIDPDDELAPRVAAAYAESGGRLGPLRKGRIGTPLDQHAPVYEAPPAFGTRSQRRAYELSVKLGDAYEAHTTSALNPDDIGFDAHRFDPFAESRVTVNERIGLDDPGSVGDLTANRLGARLALELFAQPGAPLTFDVVAPRPFAPGAGIPTSRYVAEELLMIELATNDVPNPEARLLELSRATDGAAPDDLLRRLVRAFDALDPLPAKKRARFYAAFQARSLEWGERAPRFDGDRPLNPESSNHEQWATKKNDWPKIKNKMRLRLEELRPALV